MGTIIKSTALCLNIIVLIAFNHTAFSDHLSSDECSLFEMYSPDYDQCVLHSLENDLGYDNNGEIENYEEQIDQSSGNQGIPTITSAILTEDIYENSGANQIVYTATSVADSPVSYSLINKVDPTQIAPLETPEYQSNSQMIYVSSSVLSEDSSKQTIVFNYQSDQTTIGVGIRIHFNSSLISPNNDTDILQYGLISSYIDYDSSDLDNDPATDKFIQANWVSIFGGWPTQLDSELWTIEFDLLSHDNEHTTLNITPSSNQPGMDFIGHSHNIDLQPFNNPLEIDSTTGDVTLIDNPDYESQSRYNFSIIATDSNGNSSDALDLSLNILDINEIIIDLNNTDTLTPGLIEASFTDYFSSNKVHDVPENYFYLGYASFSQDNPYIYTDGNGNFIRRGEPVYDVTKYNSGGAQTFYFPTATDGNDDNNSETLTYSLENNDDAIRIDANTGAISFTLNSYLFPDSTLTPNSAQEFTVVVTDSAGNSQQQRFSLLLEDYQAPALYLHCFEYPGAPVLSTFSYIYSYNLIECMFDAYDADKISSISLSSNNGNYTYSLSDEYEKTYIIDDGYNILNFSSTLPEHSYGGQREGYVTIENGFFDFFPIDLDAHSYNDDDFEPLVDFDFTITATDTSGNTSSKAYDIFIPYRTIAPTVNIECPSTVDEITASSYSDVGFDTNDTKFPRHHYGDLGKRYFVCEIFTHLEFDGLYYGDHTYLEGEIFLLDDSSSIGGGLYFETSNNEIFFLDDTSLFSDEYLNNLFEDYYGFYTLDDLANFHQVFPDESRFIGTAIINPDYDEYEASREPYSRPTEPKYLMVLDKNRLDFESNSIINFLSQTGGVVNYGASNLAYHHETFALSINNMDEAAPIITSSITATAIDENTGEHQVIYNASADDSVDISNGIVYSIKDLDNPNTSAVNIPNLDDSNDQIYIASSTKIGNLRERLAIKYASNNELGQSFNLYFDSSKLNFNDFNYQGEYFDYLGNYFFNSENNQYYIDQQTISKSDDLDDADDNLATDSFITFVLNNQNTFVLDFYFVASDSDQSTINILSNSELVASHSISLPTTAGNNFSSPLSINATTGEVSLSIDPDYETKAEYNFAIIATDMAGNISNEHIVSLPILNVDEVAPQIISGNKAIDENIGTGQIVYVVIADDSADISSGVSYYLSGTDAEAFAINSQSGEVTLLENPDFESKSEYNLNVIASDGIFESTKSVTLDIYNLDEIAPTITSGGTATAIDENSGAEQVVYVATANDSDDVSEGVTFSLSGDDASALSINEQSGEVTLLENPDFESKPAYNLNVIASDGIFESTKSVTLDINNLDEKAPTIISGDIVFAYENSGSGQIVYQATADDSDDVSEGVTFSLSGDDASALSINEQSGEVTLLDNPDFETKSAYNLNVIASDGIFESTKPVILDIYNLDEISPFITSGGTATAIYENSGSGQIVYIATAEDSEDISDGFTFDLSQESDPELQINPYTGEVVLTVNPNYDSQSEYNFNIVATDSAGNSGAQYVTLQILQDQTIDSLFQSISVANEPQGIVGSTAKIEVMYEVSDENTQLPGIGFRVHFNSAVLSYIETNNIFTADLFVNAQGPFSDTEDFDNNATTDLYLSFGWASLFGNWPNTETPLNLFELSFDVSSDLDVHENSSTSINFTRTSNAEGYIFEPVNYEMNLLTASWDIDSNGTADALTDGLILLRYAFGLRGDSLTNGAVATDSPLTNAEVEQNMIDTLIIADIDDNGEVDALTDGLLLLRYLFNLKGDSLTKGSVSAQGLRTSSTEITDYLDRHMP